MGGGVGGGRGGSRSSLTRECGILSSVRLSANWRARLAAVAGEKMEKKRSKGRELMGAERENMKWRGC